jgi:hypothetical protein
MGQDSDHHWMGLVALGLSQAMYLENRILVGIIQYNGH